MKIIQSVQLPAQHTAVMPVKIIGHRCTVLLEPSSNLVDMLHIEESLLEVVRNGTAVIVVSNTSKTEEKGRVKNSPGFKYG